MVDRPNRSPRRGGSEALPSSSRLASPTKSPSKRRAASPRRVASPSARARSARLASPKTPKGGATPKASPAAGAAKGAAKGAVKKKKTSRPAKTWLLLALACAIVAFGIHLLVTPPSSEPVGTSRAADFFKKNPFYKLPKLFKRKKDKEDIPQGALEQAFAKIMPSGTNDALEQAFAKIMPSGTNDARSVT